MRKLGLLGGMSWESTAVYYRLLNEGVRYELGGLSSAELVLESLDFELLATRQHEDDWDGIGRELASAARRLAAAGAEALLLCTNTMHRLHAEIQAAAGRPLIHVADVTAAALSRKGLHRPVLLGTRFTMEGEFLRRRLEEAGSLAVVTPGEADRRLVHSIIYDELCRGVVSDQSRSACVEVLERLFADGADSVILGCTELGLLIREQDLPAPVFDTTAIHAAAGVAFMLDALPGGGRAQS